MKIGDLTELATQNLREAILRNSLTTLGIAVGVASLVAMLSLGVGLQEMISRRLERNGLFNTVLVRPQTSFNATGQIRRNRDLGTDRPNDGNRNDRNQSDSNRDPVGADIVSHPLDRASRRELAQLPPCSRCIPNFALQAICVSARPDI